MCLENFITIGPEIMQMKFDLEDIIRHSELNNTPHEKEKMLLKEIRGFLFKETVTDTIETSLNFHRKYKDKITAAAKEIRG